MLGAYGWNPPFGGEGEVITIHQRYRQTDAQTDDMRSQYRVLQRTKVHRAVKTSDHLKQESCAIAKMTARCALYK